jgi:hypothetical protein
MTQYRSNEGTLQDFRERLLELFDVEAWLLRRVKYNITTTDWDLSNAIWEVFMDVRMRACSIVNLTPVKPSSWLQAKAESVDVVVLFQDHNQNPSE